MKSNIGIQTKLDNMVYKYSDPVSTIMTKDVKTIGQNEKLGKAQHLINKYHIRHLPVVSGDDLVGILGRTDLLRMSFADELGDSELDADNAIYEMLSLRDVMVNKPITIQMNQSIREAAELLCNNKFHALPVVDGKKLVGMLSTSDLIRYFLDH